MRHDLEYNQIISKRPTTRELSLGFDSVSVTTNLVSAFQSSRKSWQFCSELVIPRHVGHGTLKNGTFSPEIARFVLTLPDTNYRFQVV